MTRVNFLCDKCGAEFPFGEGYLEMPRGSDGKREVLCEDCANKEDKATGQYMKRFLPDWSPA